MPPSFWFETLYIAAPESLSAIDTVPDANELPELVVVLVNAEYAQRPATVPTGPITTSDASTFCARGR